MGGKKRKSTNVGENNLKEGLLDSEKEDKDELDELEKVV